MDDSIPLSYIRIWARKNECSVSLKLKSADHYQVDARGVFISLPDSNLSAVNTRHVFPVIDCYPSLMASELEGISGAQAPVLYGQPINKNAKSKHATFKEIARYVEHYLAILGHLSPMEQYLAVRASEAGLVTILQMNSANNHRQPSETLGQAMLRLHTCTWNKLVSVALDLERPASGSASAKPTTFAFDLAGEILVALGKVTRTQLEYALNKKRQAAKPLGEILVQMGACSPSDIKTCVSAQETLNEGLYSATDKLGELLIQHGRLTRKGLDEALRVQQLGRQPLHLVLIATGACGKTAFLAFKRDRGIAPNSEHYDEDDFADYLIKTGMLNHKQLEDAHNLQLQGRQVLGELLVQIKACHAEDVELALNLQRHFRRTHPESSREKLGNILVSRHLADEQQIEHATRVQAMAKEQLGATLVSLGVCTQQDFADALELQYTWREQSRGVDDRLGQEMVRSGQLAAITLTTALEEQKKTQRPLGEILVEHKKCPPEAVIEALMRRDDRRRKAFERFVQQMRPATYTAKLSDTTISARKYSLVSFLSSWLSKKS